LAGIKKVTTGNDRAYAYYKATLDTDVAEQQLISAEMERFGKVANRHKSSAQKSLEGTQTFLKRAVMTIDGDTATLKDPDSNAKYLLKNINGVWRLELPDWRPGEFGDYVRDLKAKAAVMTALRAQLQLGAFKTYEDYWAVLVQRLTVLNHALTTTKPTLAAGEQSPRDVVVSLLRHLAGNDVTGAKQLLSPEGGGIEYLEAWTKTILASDELAVAAQERFGEAAGAAFPRSDHVLAILQDAVQVDTVDGDSAMVIDPAYGNSYPMQYIKGEWKVVFPHLSPQQLATSRAYAAQRTELITNLAHDAKLGRFGSLAELLEAYNQRGKDLVEKNPEYARPGSPTPPASEPAGKGN